MTAITADAAIAMMRELPYWELELLERDYGFPRVVHECIGKTVRITVDESASNGQFIFSTITAVRLQKGTLTIAIHPVPGATYQVVAMKFSRNQGDSRWSALIEEFSGDPNKLRALSAYCIIVPVSSEKS